MPSGFAASAAARSASIFSRSAGLDPLPFASRMARSNIAIAVCTPFGEFFCARASVSSQVFVAVAMRASDAALRARARSSTASRAIVP